MGRQHDEDDDLDLEDEDNSSQGDVERLKAAIRKERDARKAAQREVKAYRLQGQYGLSDEDVELLTDVPTEKWEALAQRLVSTRETQGGSSRKGQEEEDESLRPDVSQARSAAEQASRRVQGTPAGSAPADAPKKLTRDEAFRLFRKNPSEFDRLRAEGLIDLGVETIQQGGTTRFVPS